MPGRGDGGRTFHYVHPDRRHSHILKNVRTCAHGIRGGTEARPGVNAGAPCSGCIQTGVTLAFLRM